MTAVTWEDASGASWKDDDAGIPEEILRHRRPRRSRNYENFAAIESNSNSLLEREVTLLPCKEFLFARSSRSNQSKSPAYDLGKAVCTFWVYRQTFSPDKRLIGDLSILRDRYLQARAEEPLAPDVKPFDSLHRNTRFPIMRIVPPLARKSEGTISSST